MSLLHSEQYYGQGDMKKIPQGQRHYTEQNLNGSDVLILFGNLTD